jgi:hypothetical protein
VIVDVLVGREGAVAAVDEGVLGRLAWIGSGRDYEKGREPRRGGETGKGARRVLQAEAFCSRPQGRASRHGRPDDSGTTGKGQVPHTGAVARELPVSESFT